MEQPLIIKLLLELGKDGTFKDMAITFIFKARNFSITGGSLIASFFNSRMVLLLLSRLNITQNSNGYGIGD